MSLSKFVSTHSYIIARHAHVAHAYIAKFVPCIVVAVFIARVDSTARNATQIVATVDPVSTWVRDHVVAQNVHGISVPVRNANQPGFLSIPEFVFVAAVLPAARGDARRQLAHSSEIVIVRMLTKVVITTAKIIGLI